MKHSTGLGRGLDALLDTTHVQTEGSGSINEVPLRMIVANPDQPRRSFDEDALAELAASIQQHGVISPITLRKNEDGTYMIIAGERRFRAAKDAGLTTIPAYIRTAKDEQVHEMALIENIQREDLDAIEIALAYQRLMEDYHLTQAEVAEKVGKKRATVANYLRLIHLPAEVQLGIKERKIDMGHARALLACSTAEQQLSLYDRILREGLSVRKVEELSQTHPERESSKGHAPKSEEIKRLEAQLAQHLGMKVAISTNSVKIIFHSQEELKNLIEHIR